MLPCPAKNLDALSSSRGSAGALVPRTAVLLRPANTRNGVDEGAHFESLFLPRVLLDQHARSTVDAGEDPLIGNAEFRDHVHEEDFVEEAVVRKHDRRREYSLARQHGARRSFVARFGYSPEQNTSQFELWCGVERGLAALASRACCRVKKSGGT
jgi:hypothetical protein